MYSKQPYPLLPIISFIAFFFALLPLPSSLQSWNIGVAALSIWFAISHLVTFVNSIIWHDNVRIIAPVWCDIVVRLRVGIYISNSACSFVISRRLYLITNRRSVYTSKKQKRNAMILELIIVLGIPLLMMGLFTVVQSARFGIYEEIGCLEWAYSWVNYIVYYMFPLLFTLGMVIYCPLTVRAFLRHRREMNEFLGSNPVVDHRYFKLMYLAIANAILAIPAIFLIVLGTVGPDSYLIAPYHSWHFVHEYIGTIVQVPASEWSAAGWLSVLTIKWNEWAQIGFFLPFFFFFSLSRESLATITKPFWFVARRLGFKPPGAAKREATSDMRFASGPGPAAKRDPKSASTMFDTIGSDSSVSKESLNGNNSGTRGENERKISLALAFPVDLSTLEKGESTDDNSGARRSDEKQVTEISEEPRERKEDLATP